MNDDLDVLKILQEEYGLVMDSKAICKVLRYPSKDALSDARRKNKLPFRVVTLPGRPGFFARTTEIAALLIEALKQPDPS